MEEADRHHRSLLILCSVLSLIAGGLIGYLTPHPWSQPVAIITPDPTSTPPPTPTPSPLRVYVSGEVAAPAVYRLAPGSLVEDAIRAAGGPASDADLDRINLARELTDQQQVHVPREGEGDPPPPLSGGVETTTEPLININTAVPADLERLPHIGPATAQRIVEYRETNGAFEAVEEILNVPGVGPAILEEIQAGITVE
ncbi:MAG: ComEA family DNA-binding protein [Anaerolineae bacterium]|jgi:competence protein ComEA